MSDESLQVNVHEIMVWKYSFSNIKMKNLHQVSGSSFLLWVSENYKDFKRLADELTAKEVRIDLLKCILFWISYSFAIIWKYITLAEQKEVPDERDDSEKIMEIMQVLRWYFLERKYENTIDFQFS